MIIVVSAQRRKDMCPSGHLSPIEGTPTPNKGEDAMMPATSPSQRSGLSLGNALPMKPFHPTTGDHEA